MLLVAFIIALCSPVALRADDAAEASGAYYESALRYVEAGDPRAAVIELKNALQSDPTNAEARLLLGEVYVRLGDGGGAEKELRAAERLGIRRIRLAVALGRALLLQGRFDKVLEEFSGAAYQPPLDVEILLLRAEAHAGLGKADAARRDYEASAEKAPRDARVPYGIGRLELAQGRFAEAEAQAAAALDRQADLSEARLLLAEARRLDGRPQAALEPFQQVLAEAGQLAGIRLRAHLGLASSLISLGRDSEAQSELAAARAITPNIPLAAYLQALIDVRRQDYLSARQALDAAAPELETFAPAQFLFGAVYYQAGELETARAWLTRHLRARPDSLPARKLLAASLLRLRATEEALEVLEPARAQAPDDPQVLLLLGNAYLASGRVAEASDLLKRAAELAPRDPRVLSQLAVSQLATGERDEATTTLNATFDLGADASAIGYALAFAHLQAGAFDDALSVAQELRRRFPQSVIAANLEGGAYAALGKLNDARASFESVLAIDPAFHEARTNLAALKAQAGDYAGAEAEYQTVLAADAGNTTALIGMAALADRGGDAAAVRRWLESAVKAEPDNLKASLALAEQHVKVGDMAAAVTVMESLDTRQPRNPQILLALGRVQSRAGDPAGAVRTYQRLSEATGGSTGARLLLAEAQLAAGDLAAARASYEDLKEVAADNPVVWNNLAWLYQEAGDARAKEHGERALALAPGQPAIMDTLGWVLLDVGEVERATGLLRQAHEGAPGVGDIAYHYAVALHRGGDDAGARALLQPLLDRGQPFSSRAEATELLEQISR